ncbi:MAG: FecR domain-containing protein [Chitinophagaceae bacterium]|nr:FecR domain-containing protein [Chitinophagaceae bacterium]
MKPDHYAGIEALIIKYLKAELTEEESRLLNAWRQESPENENLFTELTNDIRLTEEFNAFLDIDQEKGSQKLRANISKEEKRQPVYRRRLYWGAAASVLLLIGSYWAYRSLTHPRIEHIEAVAQVTDIAAPDASNAVLTLANGEKIILDSAHNGVMATQGQMHLIKSADGQIEYKTSGTETEKTPSFNMLENPRGSKIVSITLADGTKIWLNSESTLRYPTYFSGKERKVQITGEAYLEVAHNAKQPFIVVKENTEVTVLGTRFNINTYEEESSLKITLLEGKVSVKHNERSALLKPGQQAVITRGEEKIDVSDDIDAGDAIAWLNGQFVLDGTRLTSLMNQISRWYNVEVVYKTNIANKAFGGSIDRNVPLSRMLEALRENEVNCRLEGGKIIIGN